MTDTVFETQSPRVRAGLELLRRIITVNPVHIVLAMLTGVTFLYALIAFDVVKVPVSGHVIETMGVVAASVFLALAGWYRLVIRDSK